MPGARQTSAWGGSPARRRLLAGGISMSGPKRCVPCKKSRQPIVDLSGMPRLRLRDYIPMEHKAMIVGRCIQVWMHRRSRRGILFEVVPSVRTALRPG